MAVAREQLKGLELRARELERSLEAHMGAVPAASDGTLQQHLDLDARAYFFYIDDICYEQPEVLRRPGQLRMAVSAINEVDQEPLPDITYLHSCVGGRGVMLEMEPEFLIGCSCEVDCSRCSECSCRHEQQLHGTDGSAYSADGRLVAEPGTYVYECNSACSCSASCHNRVVQRGICTTLQVFKTRNKGWAVRTLQHIPEGTFVCEYTGEIISTEEAEQRGLQYDKEGFSTLFDLDATGRDCDFTIDATYKCGVARFLNHSCAPNLRQYSVWVDNVSASLPRIAFFALRAIEAFEELTFDYKYGDGGHKIVCQCGAPGCRKWLY